MLTNKTNKNGNSDKRLPANGILGKKWDLQLFRRQLGLWEIDLNTD